MWLVFLFRAPLELRRYQYVHGNVIRTSIDDLNSGNSGVTIMLEAADSYKRATDGSRSPGLYVCITSLWGNEQFGGHAGLFDHPQSL